MKIDRHTPKSFPEAVKLGPIAALNLSACVTGRRFCPLFEPTALAAGIAAKCSHGSPAANAVGSSFFRRDGKEIEISSTLLHFCLRSRVPRPTLKSVVICAIALIFLGGSAVLSGHHCVAADSIAQPTLSSPPPMAAEVPLEPLSQPKAVALLQHTIDRLANGPAFNAAVRQRVWAFGREVLGIGTYEQAGFGSGRFNLQLTMFDGVGKHTLQQISDGRLAWTRTSIADQVSLRRVDVGRLDEWIPLDRLSEDEFPRHSPDAAAGDQDSQSTLDINIPPRLKVGAWTELLDTIQRDHVLRLGSSTIESRPVLVITGTLKATVRQEVLAAADQVWPEMYPATVKVAIATMPDPDTGFGEGLPIRFEFWADPQQDRSEKGKENDRRARLITLIEMFALHPMAAPPVQRFRFENQDSDVNFVNETDRYLQRYGVRITDSQRRLLLR